MQADLSYQKATELNDKAPQAWQGLSELYHETQQWVKAAEADQVLVSSVLAAATASTASTLLQQGCA